MKPVTQKELFDLVRQHLALYPVAFADSELPKVVPLLAARAFTDCAAYASQPYVLQYGGSERAVDMGKFNMSAIIDVVSYDVAGASTITNWARAVGLFTYPGAATTPVSLLSMQALRGAYATVFTNLDGKKQYQFDTTTKILYLTNTSANVIIFALPWIGVNRTEMYLTEYQQTFLVEGIVANIMAKSNVILQQGSAVGTAITASPDYWDTYYDKQLESYRDKCPPPIWRNRRR